MKHSLVPTDFSVCSAAAIRYAIKFAESNNGKLLFFHSTFLAIPTSSSSATYNNILKLEKATKLKRLTSFVDKIYEDMGIKQNSKRIKFLIKFGPSLIGNVKETVSEQLVDLIIAGTHGAGGWKKIFMGSNAAHLIESSDVPVLAIPCEYKFKGINKLAYAAESLETIPKELKTIYDVTQKLNADLHIFHITVGSESWIETQKKRATSVLKDLTKKYKGNWMHLEIIKAENAMLTSEIKNFVKKNRPDILIMRTHKRSVFGKIFNASETKKISYSITVPLLAIQ